MRSAPTEPLYQRALKACADHLERGHVIAYPSDSLWGLGCNAANTVALDRLKGIKRRPGEKKFITLVSSVRMLQQVVDEIPEMAWDLLDLSEQPLTIVYPKATKPFHHLSSEEGKIAVRLVKTGFAHDLLNRFRNPLVSTSANLSGQDTPLTFTDISTSLLDDVDYVAEVNEPDMSGKPSRVIELNMDGRFRILR